MGRGEKEEEQQHSITPSRAAALPPAPATAVDVAVQEAWERPIKGGGRKGYRCLWRMSIFSYDDSGWSCDNLVYMTRK